MTSSLADSPQLAQHVPGELLVKFKNEASRAFVSAFTSALGATELQVLSVNANANEEVHHIKLPDGVSVEQAIAQYRTNPAVEYVEPNYIRQFMVIPNDPEFTKLWGLRNTGQSVNNTFGTANADIHAVEAWDITTGSPNVIVAVIDTGIAYDHPDLAPNMWANPGEVPNNGIDDDGNGYVDDIRGWDFVMNDNDPMDPVDLNPATNPVIPSPNPGHGTHVAGTIAAAGNNGIGVTGVMWTAKLMALKAGGLGGLPDSAQIAAIKYAVEKGARVINASFGGPGCSQSVYNELKAANDAGVLFVAAAGNGGSDGIGDDNDVTPNFPSGHSVSVNCNGVQLNALPNVISVAATDQNDQLASFSNFGATSVQVAAPGFNTYSTKPTSNITTIVNHTFDSNPANPGYTFSGSNNTWGISTTVSSSPSNSLADSPPGDYSNNTASFATAPTFSTQNQRGCRFDSRLRLATFDSSDMLTTWISDNGGSTWSQVSGLFGSTGGLFTTFTWSEVRDGISNARFQFGFVSGPTGTSDGAYLDNVRVYCVSGAPSGAIDYQFLAGTSMATPHVAGLAGLLLAAKPSLTVAQLRAAILNTVDVKAALSSAAVPAAKISTMGRINARAALVNVVSNFTVTVNKAGTGSGTVTSNLTGISCGGTCSAQFAQGTSVTLSAVASSGSTFAGWSGGGCSGTGICTVSSDAAVTATFNVIPPPAPPSGGGGGCTIAQAGSADALFPALLIISLALLGWRRSRKSL